MRSSAPWCARAWTLPPRAGAVADRELELAERLVDRGVARIDRAPPAAPLERARDGMLAVRARRLLRELARDADDLTELGAHRRDADRLVGTGILRRFEIREASGEIALRDRELRGELIELARRRLLHHRGHDVLRPRALPVRHRGARDLDEPLRVGAGKLRGAREDIAVRFTALGRDWHERHHLRIAIAGEHALAQRRPRELPRRRTAPRRLKDVLRVLEVRRQRVHVEVLGEIDDALGGAVVVGALPQRRRGHRPRDVRVRTDRDGVPRAHLIGGRDRAVARQRGRADEAQLRRALADRQQRVDRLFALPRRQLRERRAQLPQRTDQAVVRLRGETLGPRLLAVRARRDSGTRDRLLREGRERGGELLVGRRGRDAARCEREIAELAMPPFVFSAANAAYSVLRSCVAAALAISWRCACRHSGVPGDACAICGCQKLAR